MTQPSARWQVFLDTEKGRLSLVEPNQGDKEGHQMMFPFVWLRFNCQCSECFHPVTHTRAMLMQDLDPDIIPENVKVTEENDIEITWPDHHHSVFTSDWLKARQFENSSIQERLQEYTRRPVLWGREMKDKLQRISFNELLSEKQTLYHWITELEDHGLCVLTGAPTESGVLGQIGQTMGYLRNTNYGQIYTLKAMVKPTNIAYTSATLTLHTDFPYFRHTPGVQMIHCISQVQSVGGDNMFSDGFRVAQAMREEFPEQFEILTSWKLDYRNIGEDQYKFHLKLRVPAIELNREGKVVKINYNTTAMDTALNLPLDQVRPLYDALVIFDRMLHSERFCIEFKLKPGEIVCFHNSRLLHGRRGFQVMTDGERHLEGAYLDWDEMRSMRRVLEAQLKTV